MPPSLLPPDMLSPSVWLGALLLVLVFLGHTASGVFCYNRINATGFSRKSIKRMEKLIIVLWLVMPIAVVGGDFEWWSERASLLLSRSSSLSSAAFRDIPWLSGIFAIYSLTAFVLLFPDWLRGRRELRSTPLAVKTLQPDDGSLRILPRREIFQKPWVRACGYLPGNELHKIEANRHHVHLDRLPTPLDSLVIGHLSDLHLTGYMHRGFYHQAIAMLMEHRPDMILLSGDIIDFDHCLPQLPPLLESLEAPLGRFYVLGNHDRRLSQPTRLRGLFAELGWHGLGEMSKEVEHRGESIFLVGNERPWFNLPERSDDERRTTPQRSQAGLRIGVSHSPDQLKWGQSLGLDLLFCGHTHGGQVRLPCIGPIIAPSWYGSRYASGWFEHRRTLMHVSRGLSGTHPIRFRCRPEISIVVVKKSNPSIPITSSRP